MANLTASHSRSGIIDIRALLSTKVDQEMETPDNICEERALTQREKTFYNDNFTVERETSSYRLVEAKKAMKTIQIPKWTVKPLYL